MLLLLLLPIAWQKIEKTNPDDPGMTTSVEGAEGVGVT